MTSTDLQLKRPAQIVERPTGPITPPPMPDPDSSHVKGSAFVLLTALIGAGAGVKLHPEYLEVSTTAVFAAIVLFLVCAGRYSLQKEQ